MQTTQPALTRKPLHTRAVTYRAYARSDGLWDIEGRLVDTKDYAFERFEGTPLEPGLPAHHMFITVTVDDRLTVTAASASMFDVPFGECQGAAAPLSGLVGATMGRGWRKAIDDAMGGVGGCTHLRELLSNMATAAIQAVPPYQELLRSPNGRHPERTRTAPHFIDKCMSWRSDGPVVERIYPQFFISRE